MVYADRFVPDDEKRRARETGERTDQYPDALTASEPGTKPAMNAA